MVCRKSGLRRVKGKEIGKGVEKDRVEVAGRKWREEIVRSVHLGS